MPHQCVRCNTFYADGSNEILTGCNCGGKLFFFMKQEKMEELKRLQEYAKKLSSKEKQEIEEDIYEIAGSEIDRTEPVVLDLESVRIIEPGKYEIDLVQLFKGEPLIFKLEEGKYMIDLIETFRSMGKQKQTNRKKRG